MDAYEIRLELLKLAQSIETDRISSERQRLEMDWSARNEISAGTPFPKLPEVTYEDVIKVATELNKFISRKD